MRSQITAALVALTFVSTGVAPAVTLFQADDFSSGLSGWTEGAPSPNKPTIADTGLSGGAYLSNVSTGTGGAGSRMVMWNDAQWSGDFIGAGVTAIEFRALSTGQSPFDFRFAFNGAGGWFFTSSIRIDDFAAGPDLGGFVLPIGESDLTHASGGTGSYADTMASVVRMEIISSTAAPQIGNSAAVLAGDRVNATLFVDDIRAIPEPAGASLLLLALICGAVRRRR